MQCFADFNQHFRIDVLVFAELRQRASRDARFRTQLRLGHVFVNQQLSQFFIRYSHCAILLYSNLKCENRIIYLIIAHGPDFLKTYMSFFPKHIDFCKTMSIMVLEISEHANF